MKSLVFIMIVLASGCVSAETSVEQSNIGKVTAILNFTNALNASISNTASGNLAILNKGNKADFDNRNIKVSQNNVGDITSNFANRTITNQAVEQNVAGTLAVIN